MTFTFDDKNTFRNVGIGTTNNKIIIMNVSKSTDNLSFHSTTNDTSVDIMNIKTLLNKHQNKELHLSAYDGSTINPIIKINNTHQHVNIMSNLNVASNLNVFSNLNVTGDTKLSGNLNITKDSDNSFINFNFDSLNPGNSGQYIDLLRFKPSQYQDNSNSTSGALTVPNTSYLSLSGYEHSFEVLFNDAQEVWTNYTAFSLNFDGRVGIGTKYSSDKLLVDGTTQINGATQINNKLYISDSSSEYSSIGLNMERSDGDDRTHSDDCMVEFRCPHSKYNAFVAANNYSTSRLRLVSGGYYETEGENNINHYHNCVIEMVRAGPIESGDTKFISGYFFIKHDGNFYMTGDTQSITLNVQNKVIASGSELTSDDRLKFNEELLLNVTETLLKLRPQKYDKANELINPTNYNKESGFIAQEIYYEIPELRYLINVPDDATLIDDNKYRNFSDIQNDPDYSNWGSTSSSVNYISIIPYLVSGFQEHNTRIVNLENENYTLKNENELLKTQVNELTNIINKLKTATSFEEFKQTL